jgi:hypothetical protein
VTLIDETFMICFLDYIDSGVISNLEKSETQISPILQISPNYGNIGVKI